MKVTPFPKELAKLKTKLNAHPLIKLHRRFTTDYSENCGEDYYSEKINFLYDKGGRLDLDGSYSYKNSSVSPTKKIKSIRSVTQAHDRYQNSASKRLDSPHPHSFQEKTSQKN